MIAPNPFDPGPPKRDDAPRLGSNGANRTELIEAAKDYSRRGWSVIPLKGKVPAVGTWKLYQSQRVTDDAGLVRWFSQPGVTGIGIVLGPVSGHLFVRDFDDADAYRRWAVANPGLAAALPTVKTCRGFHVYGQAPDAAFAKLPDGELRAAGQYVAAPPSVHPTGVEYQWLVPLGPDDVPEVDVPASGLDRSHLPEMLLRATESPESAEKPEKLENSESPEKQRHCIGISEAQSALPLGCAGDELAKLIDLAIEATKPTAHGQRHRRLFLFARHLKAIPELKDRPLRELRPIVKRWYDAARPFIQTLDFEVNWGEFAGAWARIRHAHGESPLYDAMRRAAASDPPACAAAYDNPALRLLVALCRELQRIAGENPFFLSGRKAGELAGVDPGTGSRWLTALVADEVLIVTERAPRGATRATRYRYRGEL